MIRVPPSSISLSERDIDFHLQQAEIYHGLLKQGFKKDDILRYLTDYRRATAEVTGHGLDALRLSIPSAVELASLCSREPTPEGFDRQGPRGCKTNHSSSDSTQGSSYNINNVAEDASGLQETGPTDIHPNEVGPDHDPVSPSSMPPTTHVNQHAPRKSSLLRFAKAASPEDASEGSEEENALPAQRVSLRPRSYRRRSQTYPYQSSDQEPTTDILSQDCLVDKMDQISLGRIGSQRNSANASPEGPPFSLPPPFSATPRAHSLLDVDFASPVEDTSINGNSVGGSNFTHIRSTATVRRSSSLLGQDGSAFDMPSSPPVLVTPQRQSFGQLHASSGSSQLPTTPTPIRNAAAIPWTEPRNHRHRYLDGNAFSVYNDSLPANSQPQTPADLSRAPLITEQDAAYTAPPGMVRPGSIASRNGWDQELGEQSPTARAISLRERRNRELMRSMRAEGIRLERLRLRDESLFTRRATEANRIGEGVHGGRHEAEGLHPLPDDLWRDDLDADRVGEENFEADAEVSQRRVMRVVSGNARFEAWEGGIER